jgi:hypothetical protein
VLFVVLLVVVLVLLSRPGLGTGLWTSWGQRVENQSTPVHYMWRNYTGVTTRCRNLDPCDARRKRFGKTPVAVCIRAGQGTAAARRDTPKLVLV